MGTHEQVVNQACQFLNDWRHAVVIDGRPEEAIQSRLPVKWMPPSKGRMKCNIDAAFREGGRRMGIGACLRDDRGHCVHAFTTLKPYLPTMKEDEALAILHTLEYLKNNGFHDTLIWWKLPVRWWLETFSVGTMTIWNLAASLINKCRRFLLDILNVSIGFIRRQANSVAHSLAKVTNSFASPCYFDVLPDCIAAHIYSEII